MTDLPKTPFLNEVVIRFGISIPKNIIMYLYLSALGVTRHIEGADEFQYH